MRLPIAVLCLLLATTAGNADGPRYRVGVVSESGDIVTWLTPTMASLEVERVVPVGIMPTDGADPGAIDVIDLWSRRRVASVPIPGQPTGITILPSHATSPGH